MKKLLGITGLVLVLFLCGCSKKASGSFETSMPEAAANSENSASVPSGAGAGISSVPEEEAAAEFNLTGTVTAMVEKDDSYGTPYWFFTVEAEDGKSYDLVSDRMRDKVELEPGKKYHFFVHWGAARGDKVTAAEEAE